MELPLMERLGIWLFRFSDVLNRWEETLRIAERAYLAADLETIRQQTHIGEAIYAELAGCKDEREGLLSDANRLGIPVRHIRGLSHFFGNTLPWEWSNQINALELQLNRVQSLCVSLWMSALQSHSTTADMLMILATGRMEAATYDPNESRSMEGGFLVNEAA